MTYTLLPKFIDVSKSSSGEYLGAFLPTFLIRLYCFNHPCSRSAYLSRLAVPAHIVEHICHYLRCARRLLSIFVAIYGVRAQW